MSFSSDSLVGQLATEHPLSTRVFARHGIDFCCGGGKPLRDACAARGVDVDHVLDELRAELEQAPQGETRWDEAPLDALIGHIVAEYHRPLDEELPRIEAMARKVHRVHGDKAPEMLTGLLQTYLELQAELVPHMAKEEQVLFPMIIRGMGVMTGAPISVMQHEHDTAGDLLRRLRELTNDYTVPPPACNTWRALWHALEALEESLHQHIHLENNVLFPRALKS